MSVLCPAHGHPLPPACPDCVAASKRPVESMIGDERIAELSLYMGCLTIEFRDMHERAEQLVGRSVWTHEFAAPHLLYEEIRSGEAPKNLQAHVTGLLGDLAGDKPVVVVEAAE